MDDAGRGDASLAKRFKKRTPEAELERAVVGQA
jgi:hypothetical protein